MLKLSRNGIGALTAQYKSVLRKCLFLNMWAAGMFALLPSAANATVYDSASTASDTTFQYMGQEILSEDKAYVHGSAAYNLRELFSVSPHNDAWLRNRGDTHFGYDTSGSTVDSTVVSNKHNLTHKFISNQLTAAANGGGVLSNMNDSGSELNIYKTEFNNNSDSRFIDDYGSPMRNNGMAAGGAIVNYSEKQANIVNSSFNYNYVMHFYNAAGGAIYNGSNLLWGVTPTLGSIEATNSGVFANNHAGNEWLVNNSDVTQITSGTTTNILNPWKNNSVDTVKGDLSITATGGAVHNVGSFIAQNYRFDYNHAIGKTSKGGAIYNDKIDDQAGVEPFGGIMDLNGISTFVGNYVGKGLAADNGASTLYGEVSQGGAIYNDGNLNIAGGSGNQVLFTNVTSEESSDGNFAIGTGTAAGGAIYNDANGNIDAIRNNSLFIKNYVQALESGNSYGGAIANYGKIAMQGGYYDRNKALANGGSALGGAIYNGNSGTITLQIADDSEYTSNSAKQGGAIYNVGTIDGSVNLGTYKFSGNDAQIGGALYNSGTIANTFISASRQLFSGNTANTGGAIYNSGTINNRYDANASLEFENNTASSTVSSVAQGNSIYNAAGGNITFTLNNNAQIHFGQNQSVYHAGSSFEIVGSNDSPVLLSGSQAATMAGGNTQVLLDTTLYSDANAALYTIRNTNLILSQYGYIDSLAINPSAANDAALELRNNNITLQSGSYMNLNSGNDALDNNNFSVASNANLRYKNQNGNPNYLANTITNSGRVTYYGYVDDSDMHVAHALVNSSVLDVAADKLLTNIHIDNLNSKTGNQIVVNLRNSESNPSNSKSDIIVIDNEIHNTSGTPTSVVFNDMNNNYISQVYLGEEDKIYFAQTQVAQTGYDFNNTFVTSAKNDNYEIKIGYETNGTVYDWFLYREYTPPPPPVDPALDPEDIALIDLPRAAIEQTRSILLPISRTNRGQCSCYADNCSHSYCQYESANSKRRLWATPLYRKGSYDKPIDTDFTIKGIDFGLDVQPTHSDMIGIFGSYRDGTYKNDGNKDSKKYFSHFGSELDITSIIGGLYYRKYFGNLYMLGAVYGGKLDVDLKTDTKVKATIDGHTVGAQGALGYDVRLTRREILTPSLTATYNYIKFKDANDVNGKKASIGAVNNVELEAALKYEYQFNNEYQLPTTGYIKPSVIQTIANGGKVKIDDREYTDTIENDTLGRIEIGADAEIIKHFSIGAFGNYTFGSEYNAWGVGGNIRYVW